MDQRLAAPAAWRPVIPVVMPDLTAPMLVTQQHRRSSILPPANAANTPAVFRSMAPSKPEFPKDHSSFAPRRSGKPASRNVLLIATRLAEDGIPAAPIAVCAKDWARWRANLASGAVLVFDRADGGHVGLYVGADLTSYQVLGGNQGDRVSIMRLERSRCVARRWPINRPEPPGSEVVGHAVSCRRQRSTGEVFFGHSDAFRIQHLV
jgi:hypothetical protein